MLKSTVSLRASRASTSPSQRTPSNHQVPNSAVSQIVARTPYWPVRSWYSRSTSSTTLAKWSAWLLIFPSAQSGWYQSFAVRSIFVPVTRQ